MVRALLGTVRRDGERRKRGPRALVPSLVHSTGAWVVSCRIHARCSACVVSLNNCFEPDRSDLLAFSAAPSGWRRRAGSSRR